MYIYNTRPILQHIRTEKLERPITTFRRYAPTGFTILLHFAFSRTHIKGVRVRPGEGEECHAADNRRGKVETREVFNTAAAATAAAAALQLLQTAAVNRCVRGKRFFRNARASNKSFFPPRPDSNLLRENYSTSH